MKYRNIFIILLAGLVISSCNRDEKSLFDENTSTRVTKAIANAESTLMNAPYGWEFLYFPNPESAGNNILIQFGKDSRVTATGHDVLAKGEPIVTDNASTWQILSDYGPILTFNTYNNILHAWADPQTDGDGYLGDYEFLILENANTYVRLKGKKHAGYSILNCLDANIDYKTYDGEISKMRKKLFANSNIFSYTVDGQTYMLYNGIKGIFTKQVLGETINTEEAEIYPFAITRTGIFLMQGVPGHEQDRTFTLQGNTLVGSGIQLSAGNLINYFDAYSRIQGKSWLISADSCSGAVADVVSTVNTQIQALAKSNKAKIVGSTIRYYNATTVTETSKYVLSVRYTLNGKTNTDVEFAAKIGINGSESISIEYVGAESDNAKKLIANIPTLADWFNIISGTYTAQSENINPSLDMKFQNTQNANVWYKLTGF